VRLVADTNIVAMAVQSLRANAHDVDYIAERSIPVMPQSWPKQKSPIECS